MRRIAGGWGGLDRFRLRINSTLAFFGWFHFGICCIDDTVYHIGASLKDLGKNWFAFSRMEIGGEEENGIGCVFYRE